MRPIPPNVRHAIYVAIIVGLAAAQRLEHLETSWLWLSYVVQLLSIAGTVWTDSPGTSKRLAAARSAGLISAAAEDRLHGKGAS